MTERAFRQLFESLEVAALILEIADGRVGVICEANPAAVRMTGLDRDQLLGRRLPDVFDECTPELEVALAHAVEKRELVTRERRLPTSRGVMPVQCTYRRVEWVDAPAVLLTIQELGDREAAQWLLKRRDAQLTKLSSATRGINEVLEEDEVLRRLVTSAMDVVGATGGTTGVFSGEVIRYAEYVDLDGVRPLELTVPANSGVAGALRESYGVFRTNDAPRSLPGDSASIALFDAVAVLAAPILNREGEILGSVELHDKADCEPFTEYDGLLLLGLATGAGIALENARMMQELRQVRQELLGGEQRLRELASEMSRTEERERRRIAEELHDRIGQELAVLRMRIAQEGSMHPPGWRDGLFTQLNALVSDIIADTRSLTAEISPPMLYTLGLGPTLEWLCERVEEQHGIAMSFSCDRDRFGLTDDTRALLYISVRELLRNVVRHANASSAEVRITVEGGTMRTIIRDDGVGFTPEERTQTFGLFSVRERVAAMGGSMSIDSEAGTGTEIRIEIPTATEG